jgi:hypothetical protein
MSSGDVASIITILTSVSTLSWFIFKQFPKIKVEIKPIADNFYVGWNSSQDQPQIWPHRMMLSAVNLGYSVIVIKDVKLEIILNREKISKELSNLVKKEVLEKNGLFEKLFPVSELKLPNDAQLWVVIEDVRGRKYKSNKLLYSCFDPSLNPLGHK